ncbi:L7Ae/L30e/S12e/Gadd45 family ribosomal protein [Companilactobacillus sp.]|uniref:L7Ae/L30e/S12e/Gadd45 family ribosomal protein n=1 Tax=Companilactobacillus sp. TaxID=2767905 RepID=UPI0025B88F67|nr:ribosomal L7Ae/L30e/S12e/Gadd45 family protein [Companilactobacillus sp.]MCH4008087.1 ribosomal L7Ae/L30e/S12e/Gadd45 family protein [Companilactobacillus sp.]MCH4051734.1 ribosomal L7Ae/L30e/S12e/Gadd45 family protein [Companilactobacillus sp.]MCH4076030.1 ribosomal L7Ae/L30e/S12e/Gadd45 family protein [Companilactobacillus sp.]MCH4124605.1 ribosomal L7Ae/L30e/S12e/Gadd45 family protein [Companilactobacillus sp.]MCH4132432.1 ribosomal L7Ae/L30e/S12e/Gadd45 family protein [Companilactobacil
MKNEFLNFLGIAVRAGKIVSGTDLTLQGVRDNTVKLVIMASDCSVRTHKTINDKTTFYKVPVVDSFTSEELKKSIGKDRKVMGITDTGIARRLNDIMKK